jgi:hypothetical protein
MALAYPRAAIANGAASWSEKTRAEVHAVGHHEDRDEQASTAKQRNLLEDVSFSISGRNSTRQYFCDCSHFAIPIRLKLEW